MPFGQYAPPTTQDVAQPSFADAPGVGQAPAAVQPGGVNEVESWFDQQPGHADAVVPPPPALSAYDASNPQQGPGIVAPPPASSQNAAYPQGDPFAPSDPNGQQQAFPQQSAYEQPDPFASPSQVASSELFQPSVPEFGAASSSGFLASSADVPPTMDREAYAAQFQEQVEEPPSFAPAVEPAPPATPAPDPVSYQPEPDADDFDETMMVRRTKALGIIRPDGAEDLELTSEQVILGRNPRIAEAGEGVQIVRVLDPEKTVSKLHARLEYRDGQWYITDLNSTNGVRLVEGRQEREVPAGVSVPLSAEFLLGEHRVTFRPAE